MEKLLARALGTAQGTVVGLQRLSGGANMETWAFDWRNADRTLPLILRRLPAGHVAQAGDSPLVGQISLETEAALVEVAGKHKVAVPRIVVVLTEDSELGSGYIMTREAGEALPARILGEDSLAGARDKLAFHCGEAMARIHRVPLAELPAELPDLGTAGQLDRFQQLLDSYGEVSPVHQLALNWLRERAPSPAGVHCLVHGDFRNGNLLVNENGLAAVLDWERAHVGNPVEDLGYICANVWRFGVYSKPVGGFGDYEDLLAGYESVTGSVPSMEAIHYWEVYSALDWGVVCCTMLELYRSGVDRSLERAAIGRRMSESEIDLLLLLEDRL